MKPLVIAAILIVSVVGTAADAALISMDDPTFGVGSLTRDTETGYEWLDLTITQAMSYDDVAAQLGLGGTFEGFSTASTSQFMELVQHGGWSSGFNFNYFNDTTKYNTALSIAQLLGVTYSTTEPRNISFGFVSNTNIHGHHYYNSIFTASSSSSPYASSVFVNMFSHSGAYGNSGVLLYRESAAVPVPSTAMMLLSLAGVGAVGCWRRKRRQHS